MNHARRCLPGTAPLALLLRAAVLAAAVIGVLQLLHANVAEVHPLPPLLHWARDAALALPLAAVGVLVADRVGRRSSGGQGVLGRALAGGGAFGLLSIPGGLAHERLFVADRAHDGSVLTHLAAEGMSTWLLASAALLALSALTSLAASRPRTRPSVRRPLVAALAAALVAPMGVVGIVIAPPAAAAPACAVTRSYDVRVIDLDIPYNRWGDRDQNGMMYVLEQDKAAVKNWDVPLGKKRSSTDPDTYVDLAEGEPEVAGGRRQRPRPLVLRANQNECVNIELTNELTGNQLSGGQLTDPRASLHAHGVAFDVQQGDGSKVGFNDDSTVAVGSSKTFQLKAPSREGSYLFHDHGMPAGSEADGGATVHGLFGALAVEPAGSTWTDPVSGAPLYTGTQDQSGELYVDAVITPPGAKAFRESIQLAHDEIPGIGFGFNYGAEPDKNRLKVLCPDCVGEETSLSSWTYGDPALVKLASGKGPWLPAADTAKVEDCGLRTQDASGTLVGSCWTANVTRAYPKDPTKIRFGLAGVKETHVFHLHANQWLVEPEDDTVNPETGNTESTTVDSQTFGPGDSFTADLIGGAGSAPGTVGDAIFHCHLYPHFADGFWALLRVNDVQQDGANTTPDGIGVRALLPLEGGVTLPMWTAENPGYPHFIPGKVGWRAPQPYLGVSDPDGSPAERMVAGKVLDDSLLTRTQKVTSTSTTSSTVQTLSNDSAPRNEVQTLTLDATGGSYTVGSGETATTLPFDADVAAVTTAVQKTTATTVAVTALPPGSTGWRIEYDAPADASDLAVDGSGLTKVGATAGATVATESQGGNGGTFAVKRGPELAVDLPFDASAEAVQTAIGTDVTVTKPGPGNRWEITWSSSGDPSALAVDGARLTSGTAILTTSAGSAASPFTLTFGGKTTAEIPDGATADALQAALVALPAVASATVTGDGPYDVTVTPKTKVDSLVLTATGADVVADPALAGATASDTARIAEIAYQLALEKRTLEAAHKKKGTKPVPGAPMTDPCPTGARTVRYDVSVIQRDMIYNEDGWHDTQARIYVLTKDVEAVLAGTKEPEPLFIRVNAGDCIDFNLTNYLPNWIGGDAFIELAQTNMVGGHIHLVKFDVLGSDGSSNGWNYQEAAFTKDQVDFNARIASGEQSCTATGCRIPTPSSWPTSNVPNKKGQVIHERWYADAELRTVFTHDHHFPALAQNRGQYGALIVEPKGMDTRNPQTGQYYQPINDDAHGTPCGASCVGTADGAMRDIVGPGTNDDFREFGLSFQDFVSLTRKGGDPASASDTFNPPASPELFPKEDPGVMGINYRNAPFKLRDTKNGAWVDPAYRFSSTVFGDPRTPLLKAYSGDNVRIRMVQGSQEEQNVWALHGMRWREEPDDPQSPLVNSKALGISDAPNFEIPRMACDGEDDCKGDYLYSSTSVDATYLGMWGILRVYGKSTPKLLPLPDNTKLQAVTGGFDETVTGVAPDAVPAGKKGGAVCPSTAPVKTYDVFATDGKITYNTAGDNDPFGLMYGVVEPGETPEQAVTRVRKDQQPMVIRANEGDCLEVRLTNRIDPDGPFAQTHAKTGTAKTSAGGDPNLPLEPPTGTRAGLRVSLHPQVVRYDVRYSDGATVGFNRDQTVGPGQEILYRWWADDVSPGEIGATNLVNFGDVRGQRHHGLFAGLVVEPQGSTYTDPISGEPVTSGAAADIRVPGAADFRESVPFFQDGLNLWDSAGRQIALRDDDGDVEVLDSEDEGEKAFNYRSPRFANRGDPLNELPGATSTTINGAELAKVFDSTKWGDPETPVFRAYAGDPMRVRVLQGADKPRQNAYQLAAHAWKSQPEDPDSNLVGTTGGISVSRAVDVQIPAAGGDYGAAGDYRYSSGVAFHHLSGGLWGIQRVYGKPAGGAFTPSPLGAGKDPATADNPRRPGYAPIQPLEQRTVSATVYSDSNRNMSRGNDERPRADVPVHLYATNVDGTAGALLRSGRTDAQGRARFTVPNGSYDLVVPAPADFASTTPQTMRVTATKDGAEPVAEFGQVQLANLAVRPFNDQNGSLALDAGEASMDGWEVTLTGEGKTAKGPVTGGVAAFGDLLPGSYSATVTPGAGYYSTTHKAMPVALAVAEDADLTGAKEVRVGYALKAGVSVEVFNDSNANGTREQGESSLPGRKLDAQGGPEGSVTTTAATDAAGNAVLDDPDPLIEGLVPGRYTVTQTLGPDWRLTKAATRTVKADGTSVSGDLAVTGASTTTTVQEKTTQVITLRNHNPKGWVTAVPFNDLNNDGVRQDKEGKLVGWRASLYDAAGVHKGDTTTDNGGVATWYVDKAGPVEAPVAYTVTMAPQEVAADEIPWAASTSGSTTVQAVSGESRPASFGFVQLGTIQAMVWHDQDRDGQDSGPGEVLANRTVRLYDSGGKNLLQQKVTDAGGLASFRASAGIDYQLEVLLPNGWTATAPFASNGSPVTKVKVKGPTGLDSVLTRFGHYNTNDRTPPPDPKLSVAGGSYPGTQTVSLSSESGASFRYTLDGELPTPTTGMLYTGSITVSTTKTLTAIALDGAGNASAAVTASYSITGGTTAAPVAPATWAAIAGGTRGVVGDLAVRDDGKRFFTTSVLSGKTYVTDGYGTSVVQRTSGKVLGLSVAVEGRASIAGVTRSLELYNWATRRYEVARAAEAQATADSRTVLDLAGDPSRFVNATTGEVRVKVRGSASRLFELGIDQLTVQSRS